LLRGDGLRDDRLGDDGLSGDRLSAGRHLGDQRRVTDDLVTEHPVSIHVLGHEPPS
jgi:hypothetical protein